MMMVVIDVTRLLSTYRTLDYSLLCLPRQGGKSFNKLDSCGRIKSGIIFRLSSKKY